MSYEPRLDKVAKRLRELVLPGDLVITLGAGNIGNVGDAFLALASKSKSKSKRTHARAGRAS